jgi:hypothetical protein
MVFNDSQDIYTGKNAVLNQQSFSVINLMSPDSIIQLKEQAFQIIEADDRETAVNFL